jgi:pimeloyl-ACP methyl ester carboxylesterase
MLGFLTFLLVSLSPPDQAATTPVISPTAFRAWFDAALGGRLSIPAEVSRTVRCYRYVFVAGFLNEGMSGYFAQNAKALRAKGVPRRAIHFIYPSSHKTVAENADAVRAEFLGIARQGPEKLVVIGHSRGACDALAFALGNPEFVADHIQALFLLQGPFGGTGVADYVAGEGPPIDSQMPWRHRVVAQVLGRLEAFLLHRGKHGGLKALTQRSSEEYWKRALEEHQAAIPIVSPKTFYVTTRTGASRLRFFQQAIAWYLSYLGPNDGMVALDDQTVPGLGTVVAVLDAGHTDLTNRFPSGRLKSRLRRALIDAIVMAVGVSSSCLCGGLCAHEFP